MSTEAVVEGSFAAGRDRLLQNKSYQNNSPERDRRPEDRPRSLSRTINTHNNAMVKKSFRRPCGQRANGFMGLCDDTSQYTEVTIQQVDIKKETVDDIQMKKKTPKRRSMQRCGDARTRARAAEQTKISELDLTSTVPAVLD